MKHTPGPWHWDSEGLGSKDVLVFGKGYPFEMTSEANKRLIAAAPDLLEALQNIVKEAKSPKGEMYDLLIVIGEEQSAISKALGDE